ncbi:hypothetical protein BAUCODRAFT_27483 [Baudoinia panamericana UAMH 10762]|uniref:Uncharacterized protein n=1 Tax=Baudoinia panamericana (strain UAMH 10762) TaxID=717646 RepID=M2MZN9_BAUPA|nr:uncharacterized protein BAUCODRAFT_27483 [Baudoinia panamericana UAMH 10762]EMC92134.1 hypothetical protein BAUCODRAFT_27483 [Baudoinia panamericana UAMH 10762]
MSRNLSVTEPHPSVVRSSGYIGSGRGGAGNYRLYSSETLTNGPNATGPAARVSLTKPFKRTVLAGRGGAGNRVTEHDEQIFQFDEDMLKRRESAAPIYHVGRGGAANWVDETTLNPRTERTASTDSRASVKSDGSASSSVRRSMEGALGRLKKLTK